MKIKLILLMSILFVFGCTTNGLSTPLLFDRVPEHVVSSTHKTFVGIPAVLSLEGSYVDLGNGWALTAKHNKTILNLSLKSPIYHDVCDIAAFRVKPKDTKIELGEIYRKDNLYHVGYPVYFPLSVTRGQYISDVILQDSTCVYSLSTASLTSGMSGGGAWNNDGELVGIVVGIVNWVKLEDQTELKNVSIFVPTNGIMNWLIDNGIWRENHEAK